MTTMLRNAESDHLRELSAEETDLVSGGEVSEIRLKGVGTLQINHRTGCWAFWHKGASAPVAGGGDHC